MCIHIKVSVFISVSSYYEKVDKENNICNREPKEKDYILSFSLLGTNFEILNLEMFQLVSAGDINHIGGFS